MFLKALESETLDIKEIPFLFFFFDLIVDQILHKRSSGLDFIGQHLYKDKSKFDRKYEEEFNRARSESERQRVFGRTRHLTADSFQSRYRLQIDLIQLIWRLMMQVDAENLPARRSKWLRAFKKQLVLDRQIFDFKKVFYMHQAESIQTRMTRALETLHRVSSVHNLVPPNRLLEISEESLRECLVANFDAIDKQGG